MLTGNLVRVKFAKSKITPQYLPLGHGGWLGLAEQLIRGFRNSPGRTRGELYEDLAEVIGEGQPALVPRGMADLLEDRCEFEVNSDFPPDVIREAVFRTAARQRGEHAAFDRAGIIEAVGRELAITPETIEQGLFADLKDERRILSFKDCTAEALILRYNVSLAQAVLLKCTAMEVRIWGETPARFRQLFRQVKFHRLIASIHESANNSYVLKLDGPLSLFSATQKYGLQLAQFLPTLLHCKAFDLQASVRWGAERKEKQFTLAATDGLRSHLPDFGVYTPPELQQFADSFTAKIASWRIASDPNPVPLPDGVWVPDFKITHAGSGKEVFIEIIGFWRRADIENLHKRLKKHLPGRFVLCISEQYRADKESSDSFSGGVYRYKRTPLPEEVVRVAELVAGA